MPQEPNFNRTTGRLATDRFDFEKHLNGTDFRHDGYQIDLSPPITIIGNDYSTVQDAIQALTNIVAPASIQDATLTIKGILRLSGDLAGTGTSANAPKVSGLQGFPVNTLAPTSGQVLSWTGSNWSPTTLSSTFVASNDLSGNALSQNVLSITGSGGVAAIKCITLAYQSSVINPIFTQSDTTSAGNNLTVKAQTTTGTNLSGGTLILSGGGKNGTGIRGGIQLKMDNGTNTLLQLVEPTAGNKVLGILKDGVVSGTDMPANTGDLVMYVANTSTPPTSGNPSNGVIFYAEGGVLKIKQSDGVVISVGSIPNPSIWGPTGAQTYTRQFTFTTSTATPATAATFNLSDNASTKLDVLVVGRKTTTSAESAQFNLTMGYVRFGGGAPADTGTPTSADPRFTAGASGWGAAISSSGNDAIVTVTGQAGTTINWFIIIQAMIIS